MTLKKNHLILKMRFLVLPLLLLVSACATYEPYYSLEAADWKEEVVLPEEEPAHSFFLIGDAGYPQSFTGESTLEMMKKQMDTTIGKKGVIFLGDNVYPKGIPDKDAYNYDYEVSKLKGQVDILQDFKGDVVFIPGNHDWGYGRKSLKHEDDLVEEWLDEKKLFLPDWGCGGPEDKDLTDNVVLLVIDSQWYLEDWDDVEDFNKDCDVRSRTEFVRMLKDELSKLKDKKVILAMHHPPHSVGPHGGKYAFQHEFFPFLELSRFAYVPLPVVGGMLRRNVGVDQDLTNPRYRNLVKDVLGATRGYENIIFVSGHEHNLQYIEDDGHYYIVSGAGSKRNPARAGGQASYTSGEGGYAELKFYKDGSVYVCFYNSTDKELDFAKRLMGPEPEEEYDFTIYEQHPDSITTTVYPDSIRPSWFTRLLWGPLNREMYYDSVTVPVFYFEDQPHNLQPDRRGGGNQTNSLHLEDDLGHSYVLRSIKKDGSRILGGIFSGTFLVPLLEDLFTYGHPFAAFVLPPLSDSADIYHTNPKLYYLPKQPAMGEYNKFYGGELYMFEERPDDDRSDVASFGYSKKILSTADVMEELQEDYQNDIDTAVMIRARIFDFMIGDWDRHQDNWRWASFPKPEGDGEVYKAIPRDRDQVFSDFSGFMVPIINKTLPRLRQFQTYEKEVRRVKWYGEYPKFYDRRFIAPVEWPRWEKQAHYIQEHVSDSLIDAALRIMPPEAFDYSGEKVAEIMKYRKDHLVEMVREYYEFLAENVDIIGTEEKDLFEINRIDGDRTLVTHWAYGDDDDADSNVRHLRYQRMFYTDETDEIRIYALEDDDTFHITGNVPNSIIIRAIGGYDNDVVIDDSHVSGWAKKTKVYDYPGGMDIHGSRETANKLSTRYDVNNYEFMDFAMNYGMFLPKISYNRDFGFAIGLDYLHNSYGFKKRPVANKQKFSVDYAFGNGSIALGYQGVYNNVFNYLGVVVDALYRTPRFTFNYFGEGNETNKEVDRPRSYYQVRQGEIAGGLGLRRPFKSDAGYFELKAFYSRLKTQDTPGRFIDLPENEQMDGYRTFRTHDMGGLIMNFAYDTRNIAVAPTRGLLANFSLRYTNNFDLPQQIGSIAGAVSFYERLDNAGSLVWATQVGSEHIIGDYLFFQSAYVGGPSSLRGFRQGRFRGRTSFHHLNDLRYTLGKVRNKVVPFRGGLYASFDHGRVWHDTLRSNKWHYTYGGGAFLNLLNSVVASLGYHQGYENGQVLFKLGFNF